MSALDRYKAKLDNDVREAIKSGDIIKELDAQCSRSKPINSHNKALIWLLDSCPVESTDEMFDSLRSLLRLHAKDQRQKCKDKVAGVCSDRMIDYATTDELETACVDAIEE